MLIFQMTSRKPTKNALLLDEELKKLGIITELEHWDHHKHVDIYIPKGGLYIEVDENHHYTSVAQISSDFRRDHYSEVEGYKTLRIPAAILEMNAARIAKAVLEIINNPKLVE